MSWCRAAGLFQAVKKHAWTKTVSRPGAFLQIVFGWVIELPADEAGRVVEEKSMWASAWALVVS